ncbi:STE3-domain-containing protein [Metschnikowia bicuspidata var. bicuspidata NRRL YB-4993]|uniref:STE3-domain-containing protein n=1 Tax=Metschnikowia bicuspidata var. bicuspidata NRRL YB-4993 TaxID=869754 RepID=A0A1A0HAN8_9ASCO|nr:STE3-domain-containing protein [Metschnikowia bicuspidata var. bicuspidata NRRL YB-4993]OBA20943.1 STE3-domain-containing protein [Metschnikowia bicuspidata var. bicuspidata NRRL YB-4993]
MSDAAGQILAAFSFLALAVLVPPLCYHVQQRNIPAASLIIWFCIQNLTTFINAVIWSGENYNRVYDGKIYCDITVRILSGATVGLLCATACIIFNLFMIIAAKNHGYLARDSKTKLAVNILMCWANPLLVMGLTVLAQNHRYDIARYYGCSAPWNYTLGSVMLVSIWNVIWIAVACVFAVLTIVELARKRKDILDILRCTNSGLNMRKFSRLIVLSFLIVLVFSPVTLISFAADVKAASSVTSEMAMAYASIKWSDVYAYDIGMNNLSSKVVPIVFSFITFFLFGLGTEALKMYRGFLVSIGFTRFKKEEPRDFYVAKDFDESRQTSKQTQSTEETVGLSQIEYEHFQTLVLEKEPFSLLPDSNDTASF